MATSARQSPIPTAKRVQVEQKVLCSTEQLLRDGTSFPNLSVEQIASGAGLSRTSFYFYFSDKRDLLMHLITGLAEELYAETERWLQDISLAREPLRDALGTLLRIFREHFVLIRAVDQAGAVDETIVGFWRMVLQRFIEPIDDRLTKAAAEGLAAPGIDPARVAAMLVWTAERTTYVQVRDQPAETDPAFLDELVELVLRAIYGRLDAV